MITEEATPICLYCAAGDMVAVGKNLRHPIWTEMTGIHLYRCQSCRSISTFPMPDSEHLGRCYAKYSFGGYPEHKAKAKQKSSQNVWYDHILDIFQVGKMSNELVADIGAGEGFLAASILKRSEGSVGKLTCVDYHDVPSGKESMLESGKVEWLQRDLSKDWGFGSLFDRIFCIAVLEHVIDPRNLIQNLIASVKSGGKIHVLAPVADSWLATLLGDRWPYHIPGEHLSIPSLEGMRRIVAHAAVEIGELKGRPITYSTNYILRSLFGFGLPGALDIAWRLPIGIFIMTLVKK
jgi:SAM-dependent methyltransferase